MSQGLMAIANAKKEAKTVFKSFRIEVMGLKKYSKEYFREYKVNFSKSFNDNLIEEIIMLAEKRMKERIKYLTDSVKQFKFTASNRGFFEKSYNRFGEKWALHALTVEMKDKIDEQSIAVVMMCTRTALKWKRFIEKQ